MTVRLGAYCGSSGCHTCMPPRVQLSAATFTYRYPRIYLAGKDMANPTALLLSGVMMLRHLGLTKHADM